MAALAVFVSFFFKNNGNTIFFLPSVIPRPGALPESLSEMRHLNGNLHLNKIPGDSFAQ